MTNTRTQTKSKTPAKTCRTNLPHPLARHVELVRQHLEEGDVEEGAAGDPLHAALVYRNTAR